MKMTGFQAFAASVGAVLSLAASAAAASEAPFAALRLGYRCTQPDK